MVADQLVGRAGSAREALLGGEAQVAGQRAVLHRDRQRRGRDRHRGERPGEPARQREPREHGRGSAAVLERHRLPPLRMGTDRRDRRAGLRRRLGPEPARLRAPLLRHDLGGAARPVHQQRARLARVDDLLDAEGLGGEERRAQRGELALELAPQRVRVGRGLDLAPVRGLDAAFDRQRAPLARRPREAQVAARVVARGRRPRRRRPCARSPSTTARSPGTRPRARARPCGSCRGARPRRRPGSRGCPRSSRPAGGTCHRGPRSGSSSPPRRRRSSRRRGADRWPSRRRACRRCARGRRRAAGRSGSRSRRTSRGRARARGACACRRSCGGRAARSRAAPPRAARGRPPARRAAPSPRPTPGDRTGSGGSARRPRPRWRPRCPPRRSRARGCASRRAPPW